MDMVTLTDIITTEAIIIEDLVIQIRHKAIILKIKYKYKLQPKEKASAFCRGELLNTIFKEY